MMKFQDSMLFFSYLKLLLCHLSLNLLTGSAGVYTCQFLLCFGLFHYLHICVPLPLTVHLHFQFFYPPNSFYSSLSSSLPLSYLLSLSSSSTLPTSPLFSPLPSKNIYFYLSSSYSLFFSL